MKLNRQEALAELEIPEELYNELLHDLVDNTESALARLEGSLGANDFGQVAALAHMIKGSAATLRVQNIRAIAENLETDGRDNGDETEAEKHMAELKSALEELTALIS